MRKIYPYLLIILLAGCTAKKKKVQFSLDKDGYYYQLLAFSNDNQISVQGEYVNLVASFSTNSDSVFWDSHNNLGDHYILKADSLNENSHLQKFLGRLTVGDSVCMLIPPAEFYSEIFSTDEVPYFSRNDSVIKVNLKIEKTLTENDAMAAAAFKETEEVRQIESYFKNVKDFESALDPLGFYWLQHPDSSASDHVMPGESIRIKYRGLFLNGRVIDASARNFEYIYGTPDQVLKGLNFVIGKLKKGQSTKIILPSRLAFGEYGSTNGVVPPYTPLIYEIQILG